MFRIFSWKTEFLVAVFCLFALAIANVQAAAQPPRYVLQQNEELVGKLLMTTSRYEDTLVDISKRYQLGYQAIKSANPEVDAWLPGEGTQVVLPMQSVLPQARREGIVINVAEMRLYYYPPAQRGRQVEVYAISIGRGDWRTPLVTTKITSRIKNPVWFPPETIRKEHAQRGDFLPKRVPAGPDNPLGEHLMALGIPSYFIHGTNKDIGIGMQVTHGCIRMYPADIAYLMSIVSVGTSVQIVSQPVKFGLYQGEIYMEAHPPLDGTTYSRSDMVNALVNYLSQKESAGMEVAVDWKAIDQVFEQATGIPSPVGIAQESKPI